MGGNQALFGSRARKYLSENKWRDMYPAWDTFAAELESLLQMLEAENKLNLYLGKLKAKQQKRDEALAELRAAYFFKQSGFQIPEWEPIGNGNKCGEFNIARPGEPSIFVEVKSPGWEGELNPAQVAAGRRSLPKHILGNAEGAAVSPNSAIHKAIDKAYPKFMENCPNLLVIVDDLRSPLASSGEEFPNIALYNQPGHWGEGYFTSSRYERLGGVAIFGFYSYPTYYYRAYKNPHALDACKLPQSILDLKEGE